MESLEVMLRKVEELKKDLSANLSEEISHTEEEEDLSGVYSHSYDRDMMFGTTREVKVVDEPAVPDNQKRANARTQLQQIYDASEWYSVRYSAGREIKGKDELLRDLASWIQELEKGLNSTFSSMEDVIVGYSEEKVQMSNRAWGDRDSGGYGAEAVWENVPIYENKPVFHPNIETRRRCLVDSRMLFQMSGDLSFTQAFIGAYEDAENPSDLRLEAGRAMMDSMRRPYIHCRPEKRKEIKEFYRNSYFPEIRRLAGEALGHSDLRIWAHEHPFVATLTGLATAGIVSGLGYTLYQSFAK